MIENPYQPPLCAGASSPRENAWRGRSLFSLRLTLVLLVIPAAYNYWAFDSLCFARRPFPEFFWMRATNIGTIAVSSLLIWFLGLLVLEKISLMLRYLFAMNTDQLAWNEVLYRSLVVAPAFAFPGAILWALWTFGFYQMKMGFYDVSWKLGVPMHLLASGWYLSLAIRWYRLAQTHRVVSAN